MIPKITALEVGEEQAVIQESLQTLLSNDVAIYLQKMMEGLRSGNSASIESALTWRDKAFSSFEALRGDMANFARRVKMDYQSIENWSLNGTVATIKNLEVRLRRYYPGVPGHAVEYELDVYCRGRLVSDAQVRVSDPRVRLDGGKLRIPYEVWSRETLRVDVRLTTQEQEYQGTLLLPPVRWTLSLEDDFDGEKLDENLWSVMTGDWGFTTNPQAQVDPDNLSVENSQLVLAVNNRPFCRKGKTYPYTGIDLCSQHRFSQKKGCFTSRIRYPVEGGVLGNFWLMPDGRYRRDRFFRCDKGRGPEDCGEIDIAEYWPAAGSTLTTTEHYWSRENYLGRNTYKSVLNGSPADFHEFSCIWLDNAIYYYIDGELRAFNDLVLSDETDIPAYLVFSLYPGSSDPTSPVAWYGRMREELFPQKMYVDWVRVYQLAE